MLCQECPDKPTCTELCEKAENFVGQDHVSQYEYLPDRADYIESVTSEPENIISDYQKDSYSSPELKRLIIELYCDGKNECEIAYHLPCSQPYIHRIITKFKTNPLK